MERIVTQVRFEKPIIPKPKRVAAYARVSSGKDAMLHSLSAQVSYYSGIIQSHNGWQYAGVYADEALTGTKDNRDNFQRLINDCREGKIDMVITKSISRFARNTVTLLKTVHELKDLGVDVYFEEENIHSTDPQGELVLSFLAGYAQEESRSVSENQKWRVRQNFQNGKPWRGFMMGYRYDGEKYVVVPEEAEIIRSIYADYLDGKGVIAIMKRLNEEGVLTQQGYIWHQSAVTRILRNYTYTGNLLLQTKYRENHLTKRTLVTHGELPMYHIKDAHEAIIPLRQFNAVQEEIKRRAEEHYVPHSNKGKYPFSGMLVCAICGKHYRRKPTTSGPVWICPTFNNRGKEECPSKQVPESILISVVEEIVGGMDVFPGDITEVRVENGNQLVFL